jgi:integrase
MLKKKGRPERDQLGRIRYKVAVKSAGKWTSRIVWAPTEAQAIILAEQDARVDPSSPITWTQATDRWEAGTDPSPSHRDAMRHNLALLVGRIGDKPIAETTRGEFLAFIRERSQVSGRTGNVARNLKSVAKYVADELDIALQFANVPKFDESPASARRPFDLEALPAYVAAAKEPLNYLILFLIYSGWRVSEACRLEVRDMLSGGRLHTVRKGKREWEVPVSPAALAVVEASAAWKKKMEHRSPYLFLNSRGGPWNRHSVKHRWDARLREADLEHYTVHEIRHTVCTVAGEEGYTAKQIQAMTGHETSAILERYTHTTAQTASNVAGSVADRFTKSLLKSVPFLANMNQPATTSSNERQRVGCSCPHCGNALPEGFSFDPDSESSGSSSMGAVSSVG